jgi:hypothetical protein
MAGYWQDLRWQSTKTMSPALAAVAFLERNPKGFDHPELLKQMCSKAAYGG